MNIFCLTKKLCTLFEQHIISLPSPLNSEPEIIIDLIQFLNYDPELGIFILNSISYNYQDIYQAILLSQHLLANQSVSHFNLLIKESPYTISSLKLISCYQDTLINISNVQIKSISKPNSFIFSGEFICKSCYKIFPFYTDPGLSDPLGPSRCYAVQNALVPDSLQHAQKLFPDPDHACQGFEFDLVEGTLEYSDCQEVVVSDGLQSINVLLKGSLCNKVKIRENVEMTGVNTIRFRNNEPEYIFICYSLEHKRGKSIISGLEVLNEVLKDQNDFDKRRLILQNSFTNIYQNSHVKYSLLLSIIAKICGMTFSTYLYGEISCGKSTILERMSKSFPEVSKILNGYFTQPAVFADNNVLKTAAGRLESALLPNDEILLVDNFQSLSDNKLVVKSLEFRNIIAVSEPQTGQKEMAEINKLLKLTAEFDKFSIILKMASFEDDIDFLRKTLKNIPYEDCEIIIDTDTIKQYIYSIRPGQSLKTTQEAEGLLENFIKYVVSYHLQNFDTQVASSYSVRLLETLIKLSNLNALLLSHSEITLIDSLDSILLLKYYYQDNIFTDYSLYYQLTKEVLSDIYNFTNYYPFPY